MKVWGRARFTEDPAIVARVLDPGGPPAQRALVFEVETWDINCPQHITPRFTEAEWRERDERES